MHERLVGRQLLFAVDCAELHVARELGERIGKSLVDAERLWQVLPLEGERGKTLNDPGVSTEEYPLEVCGVFRVERLDLRRKPGEVIRVGQGQDAPPIQRHADGVNDRERGRGSNKTHLALLARRGRSAERLFVGPTLESRKGPGAAPRQSVQTGRGSIVRLPASPKPWSNNE